MEIRFFTPKKNNAVRKLEKAQAPYLKILEDNGFGVYIKKDFYVPIPCYFDDTHFPLDLYDPKIDDKVTFNNYDELKTFTLQLSNR